MGGYAGIPAALAALAVIMAPSANAADSAASGQQSSEFLTVEQAASFSKQIERSLASKGARLAIVFRAGRSRGDLPEGVSYTHGAFWVYQDIQKEDGSIMKGYAVYNLYHGDGETLERTKSYLEQDFPFDFVDGAKENDVAVIIPAPELQRRIRAVIASPTYEALHIEDYSVISNASDPKYQNCNEFMLDVIAAAAWETSDYAQIKGNLTEHFEPTRIKAGILKRILAPVVDEQIRTSDHKGALETVTYASLSAFLEKFSMQQETYVITRQETLSF